MKNEMNKEQIKELIDIRLKVKNSNEKLIQININDKCYSSKKGKNSLINNNTNLPLIKNQINPNNNRNLNLDLNNIKIEKEINDETADNKSTKTENSLNIKMCTNNNNKQDNNTTTESVSDNNSETVTEQENNELVELATDYSNMTVGQIAKNDDLYISLKYVKRADNLTEALGTTEDVDSEHEVIYLFFEGYNNGSDVKGLNESSITCYVDGTQVDHVDSNFLISQDNVKEYNSYDMDANTGETLITDFEVKRDWNEIKVYYNSDCVWVLTSDDVSNEEYDGTNTINIDYSYTNTVDGTMIYSDKYNLTYDGNEIYDKTNDYMGEKYIVFKYNIENTGADMLDYSMVGYNMRGYENNQLLDSATYTMDDNIGDYINIYNVSDIQSGMSAKVYVAFPIQNEESDFFMVYDAGYIMDEILASVYVVQ